MAIGGKDLGALIAQIGADMDDWDKAFDTMERDMNRMQREANSTANKMAKAFDKASNELGRIGKTMTTRVTLPMAAAAAGALKMAADFDTSMRKITGLVGVASSQVNAMRGSVLGLAGETTRSPQELADALFFVTSAGFRGKEALDVLEASAKASAAGLGETQSIADLVTSAINAYGPEVLSAAEATDVLTAAVREGKLEAETLAPVIGTLLPLSSELGISFNEVAGFLAAMSRTGLDASRAATALRGMMVKLVKPTAQANEMLAQYGLSAEGLREQVVDKGLLSVLRTLENRFGTNQEALGRVFEDVEGLIGVLNILGQDADTVAGIMEGTADATGDMAFAFDSAQGPAFKFNQALAKLKTAAVNLGTALFPVLEEVLNLITPLVDKLASLNQETLKMGIVAAGAVAALGPLALALSGLLKVLGLLSVKLILVSAGFAAVVTGGQWMVDNWDKIAAGMEVAATLIFQTMNHMVRGVVAGIKWMVETIVNATPAGILSKVFGFNLGEATTSLAQFDDALAYMDETVDKTQGMLVDSIGKYNELEWGSIGDSAAHALELAKNTIINALQGIINSDQIQSLLAEIDAMMSGAGAGGGEDASGGGESTGGAAYQKSPIDYGSIGGDDYKARIDGILNQNNRFMKSLDQVKDKALDWSNALESSITSAVTSFSESIGQMIAAGAKGGSFFDMMLRLIGDFAIQFGRAAVAMGVAAQSITPEKLFGTGGLSAIIAGGALIAAGTALKGIVSGGPGGHGGGGGASAQQGPVAKTVPAGQDRFQVEFRIGTDALVGVLQQKNAQDKRIGRTVNLGGNG